MPPESRRPASVAPNPEAAPGPEGPQGPDLGLEWEIFWTTHWKKAVTLVAAALLGVIGFSGWQYLRYSAITAANAQLSAAKTMDDLKKVIADHPSTAVAADAGMLLAQKQADAKDYEGAAKTAQEVADKYPTHPMRGAALLAAAANLEAAGKDEAADAGYKAVIEKAAGDFSVPLAMLARANLAKRRGKPDDARRILDEVVAKYPKTELVRQAEMEKRVVRGGSTVGELFKVPPPTPAPTPAPEAAGNPSAPAAAPTPAIRLAPPSPAPGEAGGLQLQPAAPAPELGAAPATPAAPAASATPEVPATPKPEAAKPEAAKPEAAKPEAAKPAAKPAKPAASPAKK